MEFQSNFETSINETDSGGYISGRSDVPVDGPDRFQIDWVGIAWVKMVDSWATTGFRALGPSATSGWMSIRILFLRMVVNEERPRFGALLNMALAEFGCRRAGVNRSPGPSCPHPTLVDDAASFPQNRPPTTTATDDTSFDNGFGVTILLVCAARNHRLFLPLPTTASGTSNHSTASAVIRILLFLPLTLVTLSANAFLFLSFLYLIHSLIHQSLLLFRFYCSCKHRPTSIFSWFLSIFSQELSLWLALTVDWWGKTLRFSSPGFIIIEYLSSLVVARQLK